MANLGRLSRNVSVVFLCINSLTTFHKRNVIKTGHTTKQLSLTSSDEVFISAWISGPRRI